MNRRWIIAALALTPAAIVLPVHAVVYMSAEQARGALYPQAARFDEVSFEPSAAQQQALEQALGNAGKPRRVRGWTAYDAAGKLLGTVYIDDVIGKYELITYAVAFGAGGEVQAVEILAYRESHGQEIRLPAWRKQFVGRKSLDELRFGDQIKSISGATLSCRHVTEGVQRLAVLRGLTPAR
ncbi:hypothetical protein GCM10025771_40740 [Niveibacterium umoris]|uniref:Na+-translocating ferredoxin:NAD+ oxidoreductase RnfG subunit n=1 Tax=Niveibacterium umoris TaxID=1193620 RepID=A0A840BDF0_9RHOO|nr:FMN-binding protein [Niveibacterium umoris]MBB4010723.1 Na+-translocating ferredoxin:NAD+ oxidoreductase RnfG subunit [Niveibacterium umoris]